MGGLEFQGLLGAFFLQIGLLGDLRFLGGLDLISALLSPVGSHPGHAGSLQLQ